MGPVGSSRRLSPKGYQSPDEGASGGHFRGAAADSCFAACTPDRTPIVLRMPADERTPPGLGDFLRVVGARFALLVVGQHVMFAAELNKVVHDRVAAVGVRRLVMKV